MHSSSSSSSSLVNHMVRWDDWFKQFRLNLLVTNQIPGGWQADFMKPSITQRRRQRAESKPHPVIDWIVEWFQLCYKKRLTSLLPTTLDGGSHAWSLPTLLSHFDTSRYEGQGRSSGLVASPLLVRSFRRPLAGRRSKSDYSIFGVSPCMTMSRLSRCLIVSTRVSVSCYIRGN